LLNLLAKSAFARVRPDFWVSLLPETTFSFPSGHAMQSMAVVAGLVALTWRGRWRWPVALIGLCVVFLVGLSRIYLGVHYPSDILAGWTAALAWVIGLSVLFKGLRREPGGDGSSTDAGLTTD
jgi:membrane-associated phospholipid phosphatase